MRRRSMLVTSIAISIMVAACAGPAASSPSPRTSPSTPVVSPSPVASPSPSPTPTPTATPVSPTPTPVTPSPSPRPAETIIVRAYFFLDDPAGGDPALVPVLRTVPSTPAVARAAMTMLLDGPVAKERDADPRITTLVPDGTALREVSIADGIATVDLSPDFAAGGGTFSARGRLAQVVYTLTQFSAVDRVRFELDGEPVTVFSPEGIIIDKPLGRASFRDEFLPAIFVDRPAWGAAYLPSNHVTGLANVFEAQFRVALLDAKGVVLADRPVLATAGTGTWGRFDAVLDYEVSRSQWGTLRAWDPSERDGSPENVREYPVWLRPGG